MEPYAAIRRSSTTQLAEAAINNPGIRLVDPQLVQPTSSRSSRCAATTRPRPCWTWTATTSTARSATSCSASRELDQNGLPDDSKNWANLHTVYTHGYGMIAAYGNQRPAGDGPQVTGDEPAWAETDIPPQGDLTNLTPDGYEGRIYFGENSPDYSIVGKAPDSDTTSSSTCPAEPTARPAATAPRRTTAGGVPVGNMLNKVLYAMRFGDTNLVLSGRGSTRTPRSSTTATRGRWWRRSRPG